MGTPAERERVRNSIIESSRLIDAGKVLTSIPTPRFLVGGKDASGNIRATIKATDEALERGDISSFEYERKGRNIKMLADWLKRNAKK